VDNKNPAGAGFCVAGSELTAAYHRCRLASLVPEQQLAALLALQERPQVLDCSSHPELAHQPEWLERQLAYPDRRYLALLLARFGRPFA